MISLSQTSKSTDTKCHFPVRRMTKAANDKTHLQIALHSQGLRVGAHGLSPACKVQQLCLNYIGSAHPGSGRRDAKDQRIFSH